MLLGRSCLLPVPTPFVPSRRRHKKPHFCTVRGSFALRLPANQKPILPHISTLGSRDTTALREPRSPNSSLRQPYSLFSSLSLSRVSVFAPSHPLPPLLLTLLDPSPFLCLPSGSPVPILFPLVNPRLFPSPLPASLGISRNLFSLSVNLSPVRGVALPPLHLFFSASRHFVHAPSTPPYCQRSASSPDLRQSWPLFSITCSWSSSTRCFTRPPINGPLPIATTIPPPNRRPPPLVHGTLQQKAEAGSQGQCYNS